MIEEGDENPGVHNGVSVMTKKSSTTASLSTVGDGQWIRIDLTADTGACDSVIPKAGACARIAIVPSTQSQRGMKCGVANSKTILCLGERRLEIWTDGATAPRGMVLQVADVHKPLLSLSHCADIGYDSCLSRSCGYLLDHETREARPLARKGNLYTLRGCVRREQDVDQCAPRMIMPSIVPGRDRE